MSNNLALFVTHHVFLTDHEISMAVCGRSLRKIGHCVPVWVDAKTGKTTEPAKEVFCDYHLAGISGSSGEVKLEGDATFRIMLPNAGAWEPPQELDFAEMAEWTSEMRIEFMNKRDAWWFSNPRPPDFQDLARGYLRFEVRKQDLKLGRRKYSAQHVVEIASEKRLLDSLTA
jgi:hypothetical protein